VPYVCRAQLPFSIRRHFLAHVQDIFRATFNDAYATHSNDSRREEATLTGSHGRGVRRSYVNVGNCGMLKSRLNFAP
jgi:cation transport regulator